MPDSVQPDAEHVQVGAAHVEGLLRVRGHEEPGRDVHQEPRPGDRHEERPRWAPGLDVLQRTLLEGEGVRPNASDRSARTFVWEGPQVSRSSLDE